MGTCLVPAFVSVEGKNDRRFILLRLDFKAATAEAEPLSPSTRPSHDSLRPPDEIEHLAGLDFFFRTRSITRGLTKMFIGSISRWTMALGVSGTQCVCDLDSDGDHVPYRQRPGGKTLFQAGALQQLNDKKWPASVFADMVQRADARLVKG